MKKIFVLFLIFLISCKSSELSISSKNDLSRLPKESVKPLVPKTIGYKPLHKFEGDSLQYLQTNFLLENRDFYKGKPLAILLNDLELDVQNYYGFFGKSSKFYAGISLNFYNDSKKEFIIRNRKAALALIVNFEVTIPEEKVIALGRKNNGKWTIEEKTFYGEQLVKDLLVVVPN